MMFEKAMAKTFVLVILAMLTACATPKAQVDPAQVLRSQLSFIADGTTTREQVLLKLGTPSAQFEGQRILTFQVRADREGEFSVTRLRLRVEPPGFVDWQAETRSLVLVFRPDGVLEKHSLVEAK